MALAKRAEPTRFNLLSSCPPRHRAVSWERHARRIGEDWLLQVQRQPRLRRTQLPAVPREIEAAIEASTDICDLKDDWDEAGSPGYKRETWERAVSFLRLHAVRAFKDLGRAIPAPVIGPGPDGGIDIHWKADSFELLVTVPSDPSKPASFYGDDYGQQVIEGTIVTSDHTPGILPWLVKN